jgi:hypothetical protein
MVSPAERLTARPKHGAGHPWYRGVPHNRRFRQFEEEAGIAARGIAAGLLVPPGPVGQVCNLSPETEAGRQVLKTCPTKKKGGRPNRSGIVVPYDRTTQPREYHRYYSAAWKRLRKQPTKAAEGGQDVPHTLGQFFTT